MPLTHQQKKDRNISDLKTYAMASEDLIDAKLEAFESRIEGKLHALFVEFRIGRSPSPMKSQQGESLHHKERTPQEEQIMDSVQPCMRVDFLRWEEGDPTGWLSHADRYFCYHWTPKASMVDVTAIHLERDAIQWYNSLEHTQGVPTKFDVKVTNGRILKCDQRCPHVKLILQEQEIIVDFFLLSLDDYEVVLSIK
ncbi:hypothetical protein BHM03_00010407 [Ensete ventricosum]|nr:hypothetical protein BHM03_00010407 [Ensete ventricosum]